ncbi:MAG TPA: FecR domain-containing protein, partial [Bacteroidales bacterium]|nr:FecR domain-containing protein [Bacteroidales bacterium]
MDPVTEKQTDLIIRFLMGDILPEEEAYLLNWKRSDPENEFAFNEIRNTWIASSQVQQPGGFNEVLALENLHRKMEKQNSPGDKKLVRFSYYLKIAAVLLGVFALGGITSYLTVGPRGVEKSQLVKVVAPKGSRSFAYLPDGTRVWLNAGSEISYKADANTRHVKLVGEAFFKVKSDHKHPFIVSANGIAIKAVGTSFNVKAYPEEKKVITTLVEGIVKIERPGSRNNKAINITMQPNQKVVVFNDSTLFLKEKSEINKEKAVNESTVLAFNEEESIPAIQAKHVNTELYTSWKDNRWIIDGEDFGSLATLLERKYDVNIDFENEELKRYR